MPIVETKEINLFYIFSSLELYNGKFEVKSLKVMRLG